MFSRCFKKGIVNFLAFLFAASFDFAPVDSGIGLLITLSLGVSLLLSSFKLKPFYLVSPSWGVSGLFYRLDFFELLASREELASGIGFNLKILSPSKDLMIFSSSLLSVPLPDEENPLA
jgi:hypothetical protein